MLKHNDYVENVAINHIFLQRALILKALDKPDKFDLYITYEVIILLMYKDLRSHVVYKGRLKQNLLFLLSYFNY